MTERAAAQLRLLNYKDLRAMGISFSREHLWRLEKANEFPRRVYLSRQKVVWFEDEILSWLTERAAEREARIYRTHE